MIYFMSIALFPPLIGGFYLQKKTATRSIQYERKVKQLKAVNNIRVLYLQIVYHILKTNTTPNRLNLGSTYKGGIRLL